jgi:hypothetical protein
MAITDHFFFQETPAFRCVPKSAEAKQAVERLQAAVARANQRIQSQEAIAKDAITARTVLVTQDVVARLAQWSVPPNIVKKSLSIVGSAQDMILRAADACAVIAVYIENVLMLFPQALTVPPPTPPAPSTNPVAGLGETPSFFKKIDGKKIITVVAGASALGGLYYYGKRKYNGRFVDRSDDLLRMAGLPPSLQDSEDAEESDEGADDSDE